MLSTETEVQLDELVLGRSRSTSGSPGSRARTGTLLDRDGTIIVDKGMSVEQQRAVRESLTDIREFPVGLDHLSSRVILSALRDIWS